MTALPDTAELAPTRDAAAYGGRRLMSAGFWAMMGVCVVCLLAAAAVVFLGPRLWAPRAAAPVPSPAPFPPARPLGAPIAPALAVAAPTTPLEARVARLESGDARLLNAAAEALAVADLTAAADQPRPFVAELDAAQRLLPPGAQAAGLRVLAGSGAPTRAALAAELEGLGAAAASAARTPAKGEGVMAQIAYAISRVVTIRRLDVKGRGADALIARAETRAADGDLEGAVNLLDSLPAPAQAPLSAWRDKALRRITIDQDVAALRAQAGADLAAARS